MKDEVAQYVMAVNVFHHIIVCIVQAKLGEKLNGWWPKYLKFYHWASKGIIFKFSVL